MKLTIIMPIIKLVNTCTSHLINNLTVLITHLDI